MQNPAFGQSHRTLYVSGANPIRAAALNYAEMMPP